MLTKFLDLRLGEFVAVRDGRRWRQGRVVWVNVFTKTFTVEIGRLWLGPLEIHPRNVRRVQLVHCRACSEKRRAA